MRFVAAAASGGTGGGGIQLRDQNGRGRRCHGLPGGAATRDRRGFRVAHAALLRLAQSGVRYESGAMESHHLRRRGKSQDIRQPRERSRLPLLRGDERGFQRLYYRRTAQRVHFRTRPTAGWPDAGRNGLRDTDDRRRRPDGLQRSSTDCDGHHFPIAHAALLRLAQGGVRYESGAMESHHLRRRGKSQDIRQPRERSRLPLLRDDERGFQRLYYRRTAQRVHFRTRPTAGWPDAGRNGLRDTDDRRRRPDGLQRSSTDRDGYHFPVAHAALLRLAQGGVRYESGAMESHDL